VLKSGTVMMSLSLPLI